MEPSFPRLVHTGHGDTVSYNNRFLYSRRYPLKNPEAIVRGVQLLPNTLVILPSPLLLHGAHELLERLPEDCHILCIETDQQLMAFSLKHAPRELLESGAISVVRTDSSAALAGHIDKLGIHKYRRVLSLPLSGGYQLYKRAYDELISAAGHHLQRYWQNRITLVHMSRLWIKNIFSNLARNTQSLNASLPVTDKPVVVAGGGESLEHSLERLKRFRDCYFLLAVDTALPVLAAAEIFPDAAVVLDGQLVNTSDFLGHGNRHLPLVCDLTAHPSAISSIQGDKYFVLSAFCSTKLLKRLATCGLSIPLIRPMGSVGVVAVEIARMISAAPLFLTGLDFSYVPGKPHSRGAPSHLLSLTVSTRTHPIGWYTESMKHPLIEVKGRGGDTVTTDLILHSYGLDLAETIRLDNAIYDLRHQGIPLNITTLDTDADFERVLSAWASEKKYPPAVEELRVSTEDGARKERVKTFVENELSYLSLFIDLYSKSKDRLDDEAERCRLVAALEPIDYIYIGFPDYRGINEENDEFFARTAASAVDFQKSARKALSILEQ